MSYILEALQEAQNRRDDTTVPDLKSAHVELRSTRRHASQWGYLGGFVLLLVSGLVIWWMSGPKQPSITGHVLAQQGIHESTLVELSSSANELEKAVMEQAEAVSNSARVTPTEVDRVAIKSESLPTTPLAAPRVDKTKVIETVTVPINNKSPEPKLKNPAMDSRVFAVPSEKTPAQFVDNGRPVVNTQPQEVELPTVIAPKVEPTVTLVVVNEPHPLVGDVSAEAETESELIDEPQVTVPAMPSVPHFRELPFDIQQSLPLITYSVHLYAAEPKYRMVKIDGRVKREGETVQSGLILEEITPTGAIFSFKGNIFRVPVNG